MKAKIKNLETDDRPIIKMLGEFLQDGLKGYSWTIKKDVIFEVDTDKKTIKISANKQ